KWLDTLTAWGFVVGLACWAYDLFMVQSPARFRVFGQGEIMGDFTGVQFVMMPYTTCVIISLASLGQLSGWPGERICWKMIIWLHTRLLAPTLFSYYSAYVLYDNAEERISTSLSHDMMYSSSVIIIVFFCYLFSAEKYYQYRSKGQQHKDINPD
ncbi:hypothetical protein DK562_23860, partial [Salmonella enterica]|nr:hypothetical protein [Salmonella enterica]